MKRLKDIQNELIKTTRTWASGDKVNLDQVKKLQGEAAQLNHAHYMKNIPLYRKFAIEEGYDKDVDIATIKNKLMFSTDVFKSYEQVWLDDGDFGRMAQWISNIYHRGIDADLSGVDSIDDWIEHLSTLGIHVVYSSGTSGAFSFVPREKEDWEISRTVNISCLSQLLARRMNNGLSRQLLKSTVRMMAPDAFAQQIAKKRLTDYDAAFLGFREGRMGNQALVEELTPLFSRHYFLYDIDITGTVLRCMRRGVRTDEEQQLVEKLQTEVIRNKEKNFIRLIENIKKSIKDGQRVFIFGAPYQFKELCELLIGNSQRLCLLKGSLVLFGCGWKSFAGEAIKRITLVDMLTETFSISPRMVLEGYSMTEINVLMLRCEYGRFHVPPVIEPVILDDELNPIEGSDIKGAFGFLDPLATSYPGFMISSDYVHIVDEKCECGLTGSAITEIGRLPGSEIKGCGGIMGSIQA
jgi:hypothetical protein